MDLDHQEHQVQQEDQEVEIKILEPVDIQEWINKFHHHQQDLELQVHQAHQEHPVQEEHQDQEENQDHQEEKHQDQEEHQDHQEEVHQDQEEHQDHQDQEEEELEDILEWINK